MGVKKKTIDTFEIDDLGLSDTNSQTELVKLFNPVKTKTTEYIEGSTDDVVEKLVDIMKNEIKVI